jgi:methylenetetrahydrofolate dehydrogenase (NADP+)/methenyltetrahydrofolate cyclohydrolase
MARLLLQEQCTVSVAHVLTTDLERRCREADILVVATGVPGLIRGHFIKPGATVIDVGITRIASSSGKARLVGDVAFDEAIEVAGAITPVPGGVGPMTIACLLANTLSAARWSIGRSDEDAHGQGAQTAMSGSVAAVRA